MPGKLNSSRRPWEPAKSEGKQTGRTEQVFNYNSTEWRRDRKAHLAANPLCIDCQKKGKTVLATVSDHIVAIRQGGDPWSWENRQPLCDSCHNSKSGKERHGRI